MALGSSEWRERLGRLVEPVAPLVGLLVVQRVLFPAPSGVVLNGALVGGRIALIALGIALVYRANRVVNFAQADLGVVPATLAVLVVVAWSWNYWIGVVLGLVAAVALGALVEVLVVRRFFGSPRLVLTVATIGLAQLLTAGALLLPRAFGDKQFGTRLAPPVDWRFELGGTVFNANDVLTMLVVPAALGGLGLFLRRSTVGVAIVGSAERADRALTLGIPVRRLHTVVWVVAAVLAYLAMFLRAGAVGLPIGEVLAPTFLVQALAAATFGRFSRLPAIVAAAVGLGVVDQAMTFQGLRPAYNDAVIFVIVLVGLLLARRDRGGRVDLDASTWRAVRELRPLPRELAGLWEVRAARAGLWLVVGVFVVTLPWWLSTSRLSLATIVVLFGIVAVSLVVLTGWAGQVSLGHVAFVGVGAAVGGMLTHDHGFDLVLAALTAGLVGAAAAVLVGYPALRRGGLTLAVSTLGFALFVSSYLLNRTVWGWLPPSRIGPPTVLGFVPVDDEARMFYVAVVALALSLVAVTGLRHSRTGRALIALRDNAQTARAYGLDTTRVALAGFAISGFLAALAGALFVHQQNGLTADPYLPQRSLELFSMVVIGGLGSLSGAVLGAVYVESVDFFLPTEWQFLASGIGLLGILLVFPAGLGGILADLRDGALRWVARRRGLVVPSLVADMRVEVKGERLAGGTRAAAAVGAHGSADRHGGPAGVQDSTVEASL